MDVLANISVGEVADIPQMDVQVTFLLVPNDHLVPVLEKLREIKQKHQQRHTQVSEW